MKVAQEIDVDGITIIINSENKLEAIPTGQSTELTIQEAEWLNDLNVVKEDVFYEINNSGKYFKGIKPIKYIKEVLLNDLNIISSTLVSKIFKPAEDTSYDYGMKKYIRTIEGVLAIDVGILKSYKVSDVDISNLLKDVIDSTKIGVSTQKIETVSTFGIDYDDGFAGYLYGVSNPEYRIDISIEGSVAYLDIYEKMEFLSNTELKGSSYNSLADFKKVTNYYEAFNKELETSATEKDLPVLLRISDIQVNTDY